MKKHTEINELILLQYVNNELSEEQRMKVEEWIRDSEENKKIAQDYDYLSLAISTLQVMQDSAPEKALEKVNKHIKRNNFMRSIYSLQRIAAILLLPLILISGYLFLQINDKKNIFYLETRMTPGMIGSMELPDGTKVWLNSSSYLKYPNIFSGNTREVVLDGEAYFEVRHDADKRFIVQTQNSAVEVFGTQFNIDAYDNNNFIATTLVEGSVQFIYSDKLNHTKKITLTPNEQVLYDKETHHALINNTYIPKDIAWRKGQIVLRDTPLSDALWILSKRFNVEFTIKDPALYKHSFTGTFTNQQIERVLEHFQRSSDIHYQIDYQLDKDGEIVKSRIELY